MYQTAISHPPQDLDCQQIRLHQHPCSFHGQMPYLPGKSNYFNIIKVEDIKLFLLEISISQRYMNGTEFVFIGQVHLGFSYTAFKIVHCHTIQIKLFKQTTLAVT